MTRRRSARIWRSWLAPDRRRALAPLLARPQVGQRHQRRQRRQGQRRRQKEHRPLGDVIAAGAHQRRADAVADRGEARIAAEPMREGRLTRDQQAHRGNGGTQCAARYAVQHLGQIDRERRRPQREQQRAGGEDENAEGSDAALAPHRVDQRAGRDLAQQGRDRAEAEGEADGGLRPALGRQIDGDERPEAGLDIGDEQVEPVESAPACACAGGCGIAEPPPVISGHRMESVRGSAMAAVRPPRPAVPDWRMACTRAPLALPRGSG